MLRKLMKTVLDHLRRQTVFDVVLTVAGVVGLSVLLIGDGSCMGYPEAATASASTSPAEQSSPRRSSGAAMGRAPGTAASH